MEANYLLYFEANTLHNRHQLRHFISFEANGLHTQSEYNGERTMKTKNIKYHNISCICINHQFEY